MEYKIPIYRFKKIGEYAFVSEEDYENVMKYRWSLFSSKNKKTGRECKYANTSFNTKRIYMHHFILGKPKDRKTVVDHKDGNGLNNKRDNLRFASCEQNCQNKFTNKTGTTSKFIGVSKKKNQKWRVHYSTTLLGVYDIEEDAAKVYDTYVLVKLGEFAKTNGLIKYDDVKDKILSDVTPIKQKRMYDLPDNIIYNKSRKTYIAEIKYNKLHYRSIGYKLLDDALKTLENYKFTIEEIKITEEKAHQSKPIEKNSDNIAIIPCHNKMNQIVEYAFVDDKMWHELTRYFWSIRNGYVCSTINYKSVMMHQYLLENDDPTKMIDHINGVKHDNRLLNLRINCSSGNNHNRKKSGTVSEYHGVYYNKIKKHYGGACSKNRVRLSHTFKTEIEAAICANIFAKHHYGDFATQNEISKEDHNTYFQQVYDKVKHKLVTPPKNI
jgi:hypothetical protein